MGLAIAANAAHRAAKNAQMEYQGTCTVCGKPCKASMRMDSHLTCKGCHEAFHPGKCGVYHACRKCLLQAPEGARTEFITWMRRRTNTVNIIGGLVLIPSGVILVGMILIFYLVRTLHWSIAIVSCSFLIAVIVMISSTTAMKERAMGFFKAYPIKAIEGNTKGVDPAARIPPEITRVSLGGPQTTIKTEIQATRPGPDAIKCPWCSSYISDPKATNCPHCAGRLKKG